MSPLLSSRCQDCSSQFVYVFAVKTVVCFVCVFVATWMYCVLSPEKFINRCHWGPGLLEAAAPTEALLSVMDILCWTWSAHRKFTHQEVCVESSGFMHIISCEVVQFYTGQIIVRFKMFCFGVFFLLLIWIDYWCIKKYWTKTREYKFNQQALFGLINKVKCAQYQSTSL